MLDDSMRKHLAAIGGIAGFLSVFGMVAVFLVTVLRIASLSFSAEKDILVRSETDIASLETLIIGAFAIALILVPSVYLRSFSIRLKRALSSNRQEEMNAAFYKLKECFRYIAILLATLIAFILFALATVLV